MIEFFETVASYDTFNSNLTTEKNNSSVNTNSDAEDNTDSDEDEDESILESPIKPATNSNEQSANQNIIKSPDYYKSMHREITLMIFRHHCLKLISLADSLAPAKLTPKERALVAIYRDFAAKKNFMSNSKTKSPATKNIDEFPACDLCSRKFKLDSSLDLDRLVCESGHVMARCQKTLFPLNNFKYQKCHACNSLWNFTKSNEFENFKAVFSDFSCLYCN